MTDAFDLELLVAEARGPRRRRTPLLFVHGAFSAAWIWEENFLPYCAGHGWRACAVSLRGHGGSDNGSTLGWAGLDDYLHDLARTVEHLGTMPVLVGHSMGGMVVQKYLERTPAPAAVLMAPVPPSGLLPVAALMAWRDPWLAHQMTVITHFGPRWASPGLMRRALFSRHTPPEMIEPYFRRMEGESGRAAWDMAWSGRVDVARVGTPLTVMGAEEDAFVPPLLVRQTAEQYGVDPLIFPRMAHAMMLESDWRSVADAMLDWLDRQGVA